MKNRWLGALCVLSMMYLIVASGHAKDKNLVWQTGKLLDMNSTDRQIIDGDKGSIDTTTIIITHFAVDTGTFVYVVDRDQRRRRDKELDVTVNAPVEYAIDGRDFYIKDSEGKPHKLSIEKKTLKESPTSAKP